MDGLRQRCFSRDRDRDVSSSLTGPIQQIHGAFGAQHQALRYSQFGVLRFNQQKFDPQGYLADQVFANEMAQLEARIDQQAWTIPQTWLAVGHIMIAYYWTRQKPLTCSQLVSFMANTGINQKFRTNPLTHPQREVLTEESDRAEAASRPISKDQPFATLRMDRFSRREFDAVPASIQTPTFPRLCQVYQVAIPTYPQLPQLFQVANPASPGLC